MALKAYHVSPKFWTGSQKLSPNRTKGQVYCRFDVYYFILYQLQPKRNIKDNNQAIYLELMSRVHQKEVFFNNHLKDFLVLPVHSS